MGMRNGLHLSGKRAAICLERLAVMAINNVYKNDLDTFLMV